MVRRRTDEAHARRRMADGRDRLVDLAARQLAAFARFRALDDLDLQFVGVREIVDGHAETAARHLLDRRPLRVAVRQRRVTCLVLAALARVRLAADAVHRDGERLVRFRGDGAEAHGPGGEALDDLGRGLDGIEFDGAAGGARPESQQPAQRALARVLFVDVFREPPIGVGAVRARRHLQIRHRLGIPHVRVAATAPVEIAGVGEHGQGHGVTRRIAGRVAALHLFREHLEAHALHAARGSGKTAFHDFVRQAHGLEDLRALVGLQRRDAHLRHHLEHPLGHALLVRGDHIGVVHHMLGVVQVAVAAGVPQRLEGQVRVDGVRTVPHEQAVMVDFAGLPGLHHDADSGYGAWVRTRWWCTVPTAARALIGIRSGPVARSDRTIRLYPRFDRVARLAGNAVERRQQPVLSRPCREGDVDLPGAPATVIHGLERGEFLVGEDRVRNAQPPRMRGSRREQVAFRPDVALERHDDFFADRIDRGVRHLREELLEIVVEHARLVRHDRQRRVVAHRAERGRAVRARWAAA